MKKLLEALGFPTENEIGHTIGCTCDACHALRAERQKAIVERRRSGDKPKTIMEHLILHHQKKDMH